MKHFYLFMVFCLFSLARPMSADAKISSEDPTISERIPVIIRMKQQFDASAYAQRQLAGYSIESKRSKLMSSLKSFSSQSQESILTVLKAGEASREVSNIKQFWLVNIISCEMTNTLIEKLKERADIESITPDPKVNIFDCEANPRSEVETKSEQEVAYNIKMVRALEANKYGYTGQNVVVGVIDTGVNIEHEDIKDALWTDPQYPNHGWNFQNNNGDVSDTKGHGTHCAGTVLGSGKSGTRTGVAPDAKLMVLRVTDNSGGNTQASVFAAIEFATQHGANVLSMSLGYSQISDDDKKTWRDVMTKLLEFNILAVVAGGNEGEDQNKYRVPNNIRFPGGCPAAWIHPEQTNKGGTSSVLTVGAVTKAGNERLALSSVGPVTWQFIENYDDYLYNPGIGLIKPDVMAPGEKIMSIDWQNTKGYRSSDGTSMAAPCVAGIVATMLSKNPKLTPAEIVQIISETCVKLSPKFNNQTGAGRVDALMAILKTPNVEVNCTGATIQETTGYKNGYLNIGDEANLSFNFENKQPEAITDYEIEISCLSSQAEITMNASQLTAIKANGKTDIANVCHIKLLPDAKIGDLVDLSVILKKGTKRWVNLVRIPICKAELSQGEMHVKEIEGNGNGIIDAGEKIELTFPVISTGSEPCKKVKVEIENKSSYITLAETDEIKFEEISATENIKLQCNFSKDTPQWHASIINLKLKGENIDTLFTYKLHTGKKAILIVDKTIDKKSSRALASYLEKKNYFYTISDILTLKLDSLKQNHSIWFFTGVNPNAVSLTSTENQMLSAYLKEGGYLYLEGGDIWYDKRPSITKLFNINAKNSNGGALNNIMGCKVGFNDNNIEKYTYSNNSIDEIEPIEPAFALYKNQTPEFITTVAFESDKYRTIGSSFELGGILTDGANSPILDSYLDFFHMVKDGYFWTGINNAKQTDKLHVVCFKSEKDCIVQISTPGSLSAVISLYNSSGQLVRQLKEEIVENSTIRIPASNYKGIYFIKIDAGKETVAKKLIF